MGEWSERHSTAGLEDQNGAVTISEERGLLPKLEKARRGIVPLSLQKEAPRISPVGLTSDTARQDSKSILR